MRINEMSHIMKRSYSVLFSFLYASPSEIICDVNYSLIIYTNPALLIYLMYYYYGVMASLLAYSSLSLIKAYMFHTHGNYTLIA